MDGWMDGRMDGWMDRWMDLQTDGQRDGWTDGQTDGRTDGLIVVWQSIDLTTQNYMTGKQSNELIYHAIIT